MLYLKQSRERRTGKVGGRTGSHGRRWPSTFEGGEGIDSPNMLRQEDVWHVLGARESQPERGGHGWSVPEEGHGKSLNPG